jgi:hypothetical protein
MKKPKEKIRVQRSQIYYINSDFYELKDLIVTLKNLIEEGWHGLVMSEVSDLDYDDYAPYVMLYCDRDETDDEYNERVRLYEIYSENLKKTKIRRARDKVELEQNERKLLEKLILKYGYEDLTAPDNVQ